MNGMMTERAAHTPETLQPLLLTSLHWERFS